MSGEIAFITGSAGKFQEAKILIPELIQVELDLPEEQSLNGQEVIKAKLQAAKEQLGDTELSLLVEDTSLYLNALNGFPGPLVKWMWQAIGSKGLFETCNNSGDNQATSETILGLMTTDGNIQYFKGSIQGQIVEPRGTNDFGWGDCFQPLEMNETFGEMTSETKGRISMRTKALLELMKHLNENP